MTALDRAAVLLDPSARPGAQRDGYLDLLGPAAAPAARSASQRLMVSRALPAIYERWWRPALGRTLTGVFGPRMAEELAIARLLLGLRPGDGVLDVCCGPGNFARAFAEAVGPAGLVVGLDASETMLARAVRDTPDPDRIAYVRGDAARLPFRDASFDAACCFAALYLVDDPFAVIAEMARVLTPGGRIAILTSAEVRTEPLRSVARLVAGGGGLRLFGRDEIVDALRAHGFTGITRHLTGFAQFVAGKRCDL